MARDGYLIIVKQLQCKVLANFLREELFVS